MQDSSGFSVNIADVVIQSTSEDIALVPSPQYQAFICQSKKPDIEIKAYRRELPDISGYQKIFDSGGPWSLYNQNGKYLFALSSPAITPNLYKIAVFDTEFTHGEISVPSHFIRELTSLDPLDYPIDELLMVNYLSLGRGIDVHALGVVIDSAGLAFIGVSGAGKSTLAELWKKREVKLLSDDRLILRKQDGIYRVYGTPWHGDARVSSPDWAKLKALYFIKQSPDNRVTPLKPTDAATRLVVRCFPPFYYVKGMEYTLSFISDLVTSVPSYELEFTPDLRVIDEVMKSLE